MAARNRSFYVYIVASISGTLYIGVTNNLHKRIWQHKQGETEGFTKRYDVKRLIYFESFDDIRTAIGREKQLKGWSRHKKVCLIERLNPNWQDLSRGWYRGPSTPFGSAELRSATVCVVKGDVDCGKDGGKPPWKTRCVFPLSHNPGYGCWFIQSCCKPWLMSAP